MPVFSRSSLTSCGWKRERIWDIWCSESGQDSALQGSSVSRSINWHGLRAQVVCVRVSEVRQTLRQRGELCSRRLLSWSKSTLHCKHFFHLTVSSREDQRTLKGLRRKPGKCSSWHYTPKDEQYSFDNVIKYQFTLDCMLKLLNKATEIHWMYPRTDFWSRSTEMSVICPLWSLHPQL